MPLFRRTAKPVRALVASAVHIPIGDKQATDTARRLRQAWQNDAWLYRDSIGEIRYPTEFMANAQTRMRIYPALAGAPDEEPVPLTEADGVPDDLIQAALDDLNALGGADGMRPIVHDQYTNNKIVGECYLCIYAGPDGEERSEIRSIDEVSFDDRGDIWLRDEPQRNSSDLGTRLDAGYVARMWVPHVRFRALADSPMRAIIDRCEELLLESRGIRATARSRLAGNGLLILAQELSLDGIERSDDPTADPFFDALTQAMLTPISEEGDASAVVPIVARVPGEFMREHKVAELIRFDRPHDELSLKLRDELIGRISNGMDYPKEVALGSEGLNHWSKWAVDDSTFRNHIEPDVITQVDQLTAAYARPYLMARLEDGSADWDPALVRRVCYWYDPVDLVTRPDDSANVKTAFDGGAAGRKALRKHLGLGDEDKPDQLDETLYALQHLRGVDPSIAIPILRAVAPDIAWPDPAAIATGTPEPVTPAPAPADGPAEPVAPGAPPEPESEPAPDGPPATTAAVPAVAKPQVVTVHAHASRQLVDVDRALRGRLLTACDAAVRRELERAGARLRSKTARDPAVRASLTAVAQHEVAARLGAAGVAALGVFDADLLDGDFSDLHGKWDAWVSAAQRRARRIAAGIVGVEDTSALEATQDDARAAGWSVLAAGLSLLTAARLYDPHPDAPPLGEHDPNLTVPPSLVRSAMATAGSDPAATDVAGQAVVDLPAGVFGIGNGDAVTNFLVDGGAERDHYVWYHGDTDRALEAHLDLDGYEFAGWDDPGLVNRDSFPEVAVLAPGDHDGCTCDAAIVWSSQAQDVAA